jgi:structural maintenance of chromosome 1
MFRITNVTRRKASASVLAVSERQALETLSRDEKTASRTLAQLKAKHEDMERNRERLRGEEETQRANKSEVCFLQN